MKKATLAGLITFAILSLEYDLYYYEMRKSASVLMTRDIIALTVSAILGVGILLFCAIKALKLWRHKS